LRPTLLLCCPTSPKPSIPLTCALTFTKPNPGRGFRPCWCSRIGNSWRQGFSPHSLPLVWLLVDGQAREIHFLPSNPRLPHTRSVRRGTQSSSVSRIQAKTQLRLSLRNFLHNHHSITPHFRSTLIKQISCLSYNNISPATRPILLNNNNSRNYPN